MTVHKTMGRTRACKVEEFSKYSVMQSKHYKETVAKMERKHQQLLRRIREMKAAIAAQQPVAPPQVNPPPTVVNPPPAVLAPIAA